MRDRERECPPLSGWVCYSEQANKIRLFFWEWDVARLVQVSGDGWVADRLVGGLGKTPTPGKKAIKGQNSKNLT